jgi:NADH dehydrogenase [ubiquinone] 1 alpha subcomplex assembly factor 7
VTPLAGILRRRIAASGPIGVAAFMAEALGHPEYGYYRRGDPLGRGGDFITAPEISQMFGELIGLWCGEVWRAMGSPAPVVLCELGPGRGTLLADALRAVAAAVPAFARALLLHLVETSPVLRRIQQQTLAALNLDQPVCWHSEFAEVPSDPILVVANELFDALPVAQYVHGADGWQERRVGLAADGDGFAFVLAPLPPGEVPPALPESLAEGTRGRIVEVSPARRELARAIGERIAGCGGAALIVDYGHRESAAGETLQAVCRHAAADVLARPGEADLTAHVDFAALAATAAAGGARTYGPIPQGLFLARLGIAERARALHAKATPEQARDIQSALARLVHPRRMGLHFQVLAVAQADLRPPGFDAGEGRGEDRG